MAHSLCIDVQLEREENGIRKRVVIYWGLLKLWIDSIYHQLSGSSYIQQETSSCSNHRHVPLLMYKKWLKTTATSPNVQIKKCKKPNYVRSNVHSLYSTGSISCLRNDRSPVEAYPVLLLHTFNITGQTKQVSSISNISCPFSWNLGGQIKKKKATENMYEKKNKRGFSHKQPPGRIRFKIFMLWLKTVCVEISKKLRKNVWNATG